MGFAPSKYQTEIFGWIKNGSGHAVVEAVAGSGKTTTILEGLSLMEGKPLFTAFNKHIATELKSRAPAHASVSTIHSLGFSAIRRAFRSVNVDGDKTRRIVRDVMGTDFDDREARSAAERLAALAKLTLTDYESPEALAALMDAHEIEANGSTEDVISAIPDILNRSKEETGVIDFDDMVWFPNALNLTPDRYSWVCVDEGQDLNAAQRELVLKAVAPGGRMMVVGDRRQSIYGFAGADTTSIPTIIDRLKATTLPLSICYRCPASHLRLARKIVPQIEARPDAPEGKISEPAFDAALGDMKETGTDGKVHDLVICRVNAPLVEIALSLIRQGKKAVLRGRDLSGNLLTLIRKQKGTGEDLGLLLKKIGEYKDREVSKLSRTPGKEKKIDALIDKVETIHALADGLDSVRGLEHRIESIFSDDKSGVVCSSVHRAKGLESERVTIYKPSLMPWPKTTPGTWQFEQEMNLKYVALTRAKAELRMVEGK